MNAKTSSAWVINGLLAVILLLLGGLYYRSVTPTAFAAGEGWATDNVVAMSSAGPNERLVLVDTAKKNIMIYRIINAQFRLAGARSYQFDIELEDTAGSEIEKGAGATYMQVWGYYQKNIAKKP